MVEFGIADDPEHIGDEWHVIGRCVTDIKIGDKFTEFVPHRKIEGEPGLGVQYVTDPAVPLNLTITRILAYGKELEEWSAGLTAKLVLIGSGDNLASNGSLFGQ